MHTISRVAALVLALSVAGCSATIPVEPEWPNESSQAFMLQFTDDASVAAGLPLLRDTPISDGHKELRIWTGFGVVIPEQMLRLEIAPSGSVTGSLWIYYPHDLGYMDASDAANFRSDIASYCGDLRLGSNEDICVARFRQNVLWKEVYGALRALDVEILPDESTLPPPEAEVLDGVSVVVEVRHGSRYRSYEYGNPHFRDHPSADKAARVMRVVFDLYHQAQDVPTRRNGQP